MLPAIFLVLFAAGWRFLAIAEPALGNFSPLMALTFCGAVYLKRPVLWILPFVALVVSDLWLDHYYLTRYGDAWSFQSELLRMLCFALGLGIGLLVARDRSWLKLLGGALGSSLLFYLVTNTDAWRNDIHYAKTMAGWWQALTVGRPEFPPTLFFFRNTLASDLIFTGVFAAALEAVERRAGRPSLLSRAAR